MNNFPQISDIILQIFVAFLTLLTSLITAYFAYKLGQQKKPKVETKLGIIRAATSDLRKYSQQTKSSGESKDLIDFIIYTLPTKVIELEDNLKELHVVENKLVTKRKLLATIAILILLLEFYYFFVINLKPITELIAISVFSSISIILLITSIRISTTFLRGVQDTDTMLQQIKGVFEKARGQNLFNLKSRENLTEFIKQRNDLGYGISLTNIREELELYGLKVPDSEIMRSHFDLFFFNNPDGRRRILSAFFLDGEHHESFDELSDKEILEFLETVKNNVSKMLKVIRSYLKSHYSDPEERQAILNIYFGDGKHHEDFDEISDEEIMNFLEIIEKNIETMKVQEETDNVS